MRSQRIAFRVPALHEYLMLLKPAVDKPANLAVSALLSTCGECVVTTSCSLGKASRRRGSATRCQRGCRWRSISSDEHDALHALGRVGAVDLVEHDRAARDVGGPAR